MLVDHIITSIFLITSTFRNKYVTGEGERTRKA